MSPKSYEFRDIFIKSCNYTNGEGNCTKTREAEKCINGKCEKVSSPAESKKEVMTDHYNQIKYDDDSDSDSSDYNDIFDKYSQSGGSGGDISVTLDVNNFNKMVLQNDKNVLVKFYAPWCGHCIHLVPEWNKLYNQNKTDTIIANFDATKPLPKEVSIEGFPTIILFKGSSGKKQQIPYEGERTADDILTFLNKNASVDQSGGDRKGKRYWIKNGKKIKHNPNGYQKSNLSNYFTDSSDSSDSINSSDSSGPINSSDTIYSTGRFTVKSHNEKPKLVLRSKISPKKNDLNSILLYKKQMSHLCNDHDCQQYNTVIANESINEHNKKHNERKNRHDEGEFSPLGLYRTTSNQYDDYDHNTKLKDGLDIIDKLLNDLTIKQHGGCDCGEQSGGYNGDPKLKNRLIENLVKKYKGKCHHCGKSKTPTFVPPKKRYKFECKGNCQHGGCGPLCLAPLLMLGGGSKLRLIKIVKSTKHDKKLMAVFEKNGRQKIVHFGAAGMSDYHLHKDPERKKRYIARHAKHENWNNPTSAGALSRWILWNKPSLRDSIASYKKKFHL